jgi:hypothetical protein
MSRSPGDAQPVFDAIAESAVKLLGNSFTGVLRREGTMFRLAAMYSGVHAVELPPEAALVAIDPADNFPSQVFESGQLLHIPEWSALELTPHERNVKAHLGIESSLMLPLLRGETCIAVLFIGRDVPRAFTEAEIVLARSFVDQAAIALENVRLIHETKEALEQQTATAAILKVLSESPTDIQPVFRAIVDAAFRRFDVAVAGLALREGDGYRMMSMASATHAAGAPSERLTPLDASCDLPVAGDPVEDDAPSAGLVGHRASVVRAAHLRRGRHPRVADAADPARRRMRRRARRVAQGGARVHRGGDRGDAGVRRSGGDRDRERPAVQRDPRGPRPADRDGRRAAGHQRFDDGFASGLRGHPAALRGALRRRRRRRHQPDRRRRSRPHGRLRSHRARTQRGRHARRGRAAARARRATAGPGRSKAPPRRQRSRARRRSTIPMPCTVPTCRATFA